MFFELRVYPLMPGKAEEFVRYNNDYWRNEVSPKLPELMDGAGIEVTILRATTRSFMQ